jgi:hypothetical protein
LGFVVNTDNDKKFKKGDILKAAGYAAPARNFPRGNILEGGYTVRWTGAMYYEKDRNNRNGNPIHVNPICGGMVCSRRILGVDKPFWECYT